MSEPTGKRVADAGRAAEVQTMFSAIAPRYDLLNHLLSMNLDRRWRRVAIDVLVRDLPERALFIDACAGTLDLSRELVERGAVVGAVVAADFSHAMLAQGVSKVPGRIVYAVCADATQLPLADECADGVVVGFGIRNLASLDAGLAEFARVLRPGGRLVLLEFAVPRRQPLRSAYLLYFQRVLPLIGRLISGHGSAYAYLPSSVMEFPSPGALTERVDAAGFDAVRWRSLTGGIATIHVAERSTGR